MQEFYNLVMILASVPVLIGVLFALTQRKPRHYYKYEGYRWIRKR